MLEYHKTTESEKYMICRWKYDGEYSVYNCPPYEQQLQRRKGFANPENNIYSYYDGAMLVGFTNLVEENDEVFFGIGVNPRLCGMGYGQRIAKMACELSHELYPRKPIYLEVRTWNLRAIKCYEKAGFCIDGEPIEQKTGIGSGTFYRMTAK